MKIEAEDLGKRFNREWIFRKLSCTFESGNSYAVTGPNGSGKSTLLQILWGQLQPSLGTLTYRQGASVIDAGDVFNYLTIAAPYQELVEEFTLAEMLRFHFRFKKIRGGESLPALQDFLGIPGAAHKPICNFSSGMKQRLKLGLAFFSEASIIFLDEPTTNLDRKSKQWYWDQLGGLPKDLLVVIASNQEDEYPSDARKLDISTFK